MKKALAALSLVAALGAAATAVADKNSSWSMKATVIEACSCTLPCPLYFSTRATVHVTADGHGERYCLSNKAFHVHKGSFGKTRLDDVEFWMVWNSGDELGQGKMKWAVIHFTPSVTKEQRDGIVTILSHLYPYQWQTPLAIGEDTEIDWNKASDKAVARLDGGKSGEIILNGSALHRIKTDRPVIDNLRYWAAPRNKGFMLMSAETEAYRLGPNWFEVADNTNGLVVTFDISSKDFAPSSGGR